MLKLGHRGSPGYPRRFENTIFSFQKALRAGAHGFELDVRRCKKDLVVFHDATLERATNGLSKTAIADCTHRDLIEEMFRVPGYYPKFRVPLLSDVLSVFGDTCLINIELKECGLAEDIFWFVRKFSIQRTVLISCFDKTAETLSEKNAPSWSELRHFSCCVPTALIASSHAAKKMGDGYIARARELDASAIHPEYRAVNQNLIRSAEKMRISVNAWTVNNRFAIWRMHMLNVHGIISDFPERL